MHFYSADGGRCPRRHEKKKEEEKEGKEPLDCFRGLFKAQFSWSYECNRTDGERDEKETEEANEEENERE